MLNVMKNCTRYVKRFNISLEISSNQLDKTISGILEDKLLHIKAHAGSDRCLSGLTHLFISSDTLGCLIKIKIMITIILFIIEIAII